MIEEFLKGEEVSFIVVSDGRNVVPLVVGGGLIGILARSRLIHRLRELA